MIKGNIFGKDTLFPYVAISVIILLWWTTTYGPKSDLK